MCVHIYTPHVCVCPHFLEMWTYSDIHLGSCNFMDSFSLFYRFQNYAKLFWELYIPPHEIVGWVS